MALVRTISNNHRYSGTASVTGDVGIAGSPVVLVRRQVWLHEMRTGQLAAQTWSATDGTFTFANIAAGKYRLISTDYTLVKEAVAGDNVTAI